MNFHFLIPGNIQLLTGVHIYEKQITEGLKKRGHTVEVHSLDPDFPFTSSQSKKQCLKILSLIPKCDTVVIDGQVLPAIANELHELSLQNRAFVGMIHLPLSVNPRFTAYQREMISNNEKMAVTYLISIIATSVYTKELLNEITSKKLNITVVQPGVLSYPRKKIYPSKPTRLLSISNFTRNKDHTLLIRSLSALKDKKWTLDCYGDLDLDRNYLADLQALIRRLGLKDKIFVHAPIIGKELSDAYLSADLFIHPSGFETYGMVLTEALAHGLPVIASTGGGITQAIPSNVGKFFKPGDVYGLLTVLELVMESSTIYQQLCREASIFHEKAQTWEQSINEFESSFLPTGN